MNLPPRIACRLLRGDRKPFVNHGREGGEFLHFVGQDTENLA